MTSKFLRRFADAPYPYQNWKPFPDEAIVQVYGPKGYHPNIGPAVSFWWGYEEELGEIGEGVIIRARRLDRPLPTPPTLSRLRLAAKHSQLGRERSVKA